MNSMIVLGNGAFPSGRAARSNEGSCPPRNAIVAPLPQSVGSVFFVFRRTRVVTITIFVSNSAIASVNDHFRMLIPSYIPCRVDGFSLSPMNGSDSFVSFSPNRPISVVGDNMLVLTHFENPFTMFLLGSVNGPLRTYADGVCFFATRGKFSSHSGL